MRLYLSVNIFSTKVLIGDTNFTSPTGDVMARTVLLNCPIKAEIRAVDSQSDLTILL